MSSLKNWLRDAKDPENYIAAAVQAARKGEDPHLIQVDKFGAMARALLSEVGSNTASHFDSYRRVANSETQAYKLHLAFYQAVESALQDMKIGRRHSENKWAEFFNSTANLIKIDAKLKWIVSQTVVRGFVPRLVWEEKETPETLEMATGIICALDTVPNLLASLEPQIVRDLVKRHIAREGGHVNAAVKLTELRASNAFANAIAAHENTLGKHVAFYEVTIKRDAGDYYSARSVSLALEFDRAADAVAAYELKETRDGIERRFKYSGVQVMDAEGACSNYQAQIVDALAMHSEATLPQQDWVKPIAERMALELMA